VERDLALTRELLAEKYKDRLEESYKKDSLMDMSFHVPTSNTQFVGDENRPPAHILWETILKFADVGSSEEPVVTFDGIAILTPRGRYNVELHQSFLRPKDKLMTLKSNTVALFASFFCQNQTILILLLLSPLIHQSVKGRHCILTLLFSLRQRQ
jgi:structure-specific recognition protein 1